MQTEPRPLTCVLPLALPSSPNKHRIVPSPSRNTHDMLRTHENSATARYTIKLAAMLHTATDAIRCVMRSTFFLIVNIRQERHQICHRRQINQTKDVLHVKGRVAANMPDVQARQRHAKDSTGQRCSISTRTSAIKTFNIL